MTSKTREISYLVLILLLQQLLPEHLKLKYHFRKSSFLLDKIIGTEYPMKGRCAILVSFGSRVPNRTLRRRNACTAETVTSHWTVLSFGQFRSSSQWDHTKHTTATTVLHTYRGVSGVGTYSWIIDGGASRSRNLDGTGRYNVCPGDGPRASLSLYRF